MKKIRLGLVLIYVLVMVSPQEASSSEFIPLTIVSSQKWDAQPGDRIGLGRLVLFAKNDSPYILGDVQAIIKYFDAKGKLLRTMNTYGAMLSRVAPGETVALFDSYTEKPSSYVVQIVAGIPTDIPVNRNIRVDSVSWSETDAQGYKFIRVKVTNLNKTVAEGVRFMARCGNFAGEFAFYGPNTPEIIQPGDSLTMYRIYSPTDPPCLNAPNVVIDALSPPSSDTFPLNFDRAAAEKAAAEKVEIRILLDSVAAQISSLRLKYGDQNVRVHQSTLDRLNLDFQVVDESGYSEIRLLAQRTQTQLLALEQTFAKARIAVKKLTITCVKGKVAKKVTGLKPICPAGYKKK